jgi:hypothetical protein
MIALLGVFGTLFVVTLVYRKLISDQLEDMYNNDRFGAAVCFLVSLSRAVDFSLALRVQRAMGDTFWIRNQMVRCTHPPPPPPNP